MVDSEQPDHLPDKLPGNQDFTKEGGWVAKFAYAFRGLLWACRAQNSFWIHMPMAILVIVLAAVLKVATWEWVALSIAIGIVFSAELLNTAIEQIVKATHPQHDERIGQALDAAAAAVLAVAMSAVVVGIIIFAPKLLTFVS